VTRVRVGDVAINVEQSGDGPPLIMLHGFTGSAATWSPFAPRPARSDAPASALTDGTGGLSPLERQPSAPGAGASRDTGNSMFSGTSESDLSERYRLIAIDLLGHGHSDSPADPDRYRVERCVADVLAVADHLDLARFALVGYSMGGRVALNLAVSAPERLRALVLESASPGIESAAERQARVESDARLADVLEREGIEAFVDRWEKVPLFASQARMPSAARDRLRRQRLGNNPRGLANSLRGLGAGVPDPLISRLGEISVPTLLIAGELDTKYRALGQLMSERMPSATLAVVPDTGHAIHFEQPTAFAQLISRFLDSISH
jgi:2-succinyl-6-hydroxy-2,4-cyclohexadiene-1-carboxylate synthase